VERDVGVGLAMGPGRENERLGCLQTHGAIMMTRAPAAWLIKLAK